MSDVSYVLHRVVPVVVVDNPDDAVALAQLYVDEGLRVIEITLRSPHALECIAAVAERVPGIDVGAGTVLSVDSGLRALDAGAEFLVSPGVTGDLLDWCVRDSVALIPGFSTVSEAMEIHSSGMNEAKFFPAGLSGGLGFIRAVASVLPLLQVMPSGGITPDTAWGFLELATVSRIGGTWLSPQDAVAERDWSRIRDLVGTTRETLERMGK